MELHTVKAYEQIALNLVAAKDNFYQELATKRKVGKAGLLDWYLTKQKLANKDYYLLIQPQAKLYVPFTEDLSDYFDDILAFILQRLAVTSEQVEKLRAGLFNGRGIEVKLIEAEDLQVDFITDNEAKLTNLLPGNLAKFKERDEKIGYCALLGYWLSHFANEDEKLGDITINQVLGSYYPIKMKKPAKKFSYVTLTSKYKDFTSWDEELNLTKTEFGFERVKKEIMANNKKAINQFIALNASHLKQWGGKKVVRSYLEGYLNDQLFLGDRLRTVLTNAADFPLYVYKQGEYFLNSNQPAVMIGVVSCLYQSVLPFFDFLVQSGGLAKKDNERLQASFDDALYWLKNLLLADSDKAKRAKEVFSKIPQAEIDSLPTKIKAWYQDLKQALD